MRTRGEISRYGVALIVALGILAIGFGSVAAQQLGIYASPDCSTNPVRPSSPT